jgi:hypothetical protein
VYKTTWQDGGDDKVHVIFCNGTDCVDYFQTSWNPASKGWTGTRADWSEETHYQLSDMAGTRSATATFLSLQLRKHVSGGGSPWYDVPAVSKCISNGSTCGNGSYWRYHINMLRSNTAFEDYTCPIDPNVTC